VRGFPTPDAAPGATADSSRATAPVVLPPVVAESVAAGAGTDTAGDSAAAADSLASRADSAASRPR
jgi:hypothetical protein